MHRVLLLLLVATLPAGGAAAQQPLRVVPGWGVDTTGAVAWTETAAAPDIRDIFRRWAEYLRSNPRAQEPTTLWSAAEQRQWRAYDLTASIAYQGVAATVLDIRPARPGATDEYVVKTLFAAVTGPGRDVKPIALTRVYAVREDGQWVFSNALPRLTRDWERRTVGPITYVIEPGYPFDAARAARAVSFADSVAAAFDVPGLRDVTYYVTSSPDQVHRLMGVDWTFGGLGYGYASPWNRLIFTGDPALGEAYGHELVHVVLGPLFADGRTPPLVGEGIATWLGGSLGRDFGTLMADYAAFLRAHPAITPDSLLSADTDLGTRPGAAALTLLVWERGGIPAVKDLIGAGRGEDALRAALTRLLGVDWATVGTLWRARVLAFGAAAPVEFGARVFTFSMSRGVFCQSDGSP
jgi:hypothetical protein